MRLHRLSVLWIVLASVCIAQISPRELAQKGFRSVVLLAMSDSNGQPLCIGSGFFVSEDVLATNAHVVEGAGGGSAKLVGKAQTFQILGVLAVDRHADLALLKVAKKAPSLELSQDSIPAVGDNVYVIGNPLGLEGTFSAGIVSGVRTIGKDSIIQMTAPISPGSSGGPVMNSRGEVIGIAVATFKEGQNLNLAVPVSYLARMLETKSAIVKPFQPASKHTSTSTTIIDGLGTRAEEGVVASDFRLDSIVSYRLRLTNKLPVAVSQIGVVS